MNEKMLRRSEIAWAVGMVMVFAGVIFALLDPSPSHVVSTALAVVGAVIVVSTLELVSFSERRGRP